VGDAGGGEPSPDLAGLGAGAGPQPVVDGEADDLAAGAPAPAGGEQRQRRLSRPPDTATARRGRASNGPRAAIS